MRSLIIGSTNYKEFYWKHVTVAAVVIIASYIAHDQYVNGSARRCAAEVDVVRQSYIDELVNANKIHKAASWLGANVDLVDTDTIKETANMTIKKECRDMGFKL